MHRSATEDFLRDFKHRKSPTQTLLPTSAPHNEEFQLQSNETNVARVKCVVFKIRFACHVASDRQQVIKLDTKKCGHKKLRAFHDVNITGKHKLKNVNGTFLSINAPFVPRDLSKLALKRME